MEKKDKKKKYVENSVSDTHWRFLSKGTYALNRSSDFFGKVCYVGQLRRLLTAGGLLYIGLHCCRLRVITNLGDVDSGRGGRGAKYTRAREISRRRDATGAPPLHASPLGSPFSLSRVYFTGIAKIKYYSQSSTVAKRKEKNGSRGVASVT